jgi:peptide/nickel transport system substrate-binding protein
VTGRRKFLPLICLLLLGLPAWGGAGQHKLLTYHLAAPPDLLDPAKCNNIRCRRVMWPIYEPLMNLAKDSPALLPGLAESWEASPDGLTYTFRLRKGVTFHDGAPFNAAAVKINLERNFLPGSPFYTADPPNVREKLLAGLIREIAVQDDHTLIVSLKQRRVGFLYLIPMVSPNALTKQGKKFGEHPVGTGPFKFVSWTKDEIRLGANQGYWGGRPQLDGLSFKVIADADKMMKEFLAGRLDFVPEVEPVYVEQIIANPATKLVRVSALSIRYLGFYTDRKPFDDVRVRQAVSKAIDVDRAVLFTSRGMAIPAYGPIPPGAQAYDPDLKKPRRYDPDGAKRLLKDAGYGSGLRISLVFNAGWGFFSELAQAIRTDLGKVGVDAELAPVTGWQDLVASMRQGKGDCFIYDWFTVLTDPEVYLGSLFETKSPDNRTRYSSSKVDALLEDARATTDLAARLESYRKAQRIIVDDAPIVPLFHDIRVSAYSSRVVGLELNAHSEPIDRFARVQVRPE